jgi:hypothetical protein
MESMLVSLLKMSRNGKILEDYIVAAYLVYKNMRCILPTKSMVRNHGQDGSGLHSGYSAEYAEQEIQENSNYDIHEAPIEFTTNFEHTQNDSRRKRKRRLGSLKFLAKWYVYKYAGVFIS